jgi:hypothetical protein
LEEEEESTRGDRVGGDKIEGHVGSVAAGGQVAVGKDIRQVWTQGPAQLSPTERAELDRLLSGLSSELRRLDLDERTRILAEERMQELQNELTKKDAAPDPSNIKVAGNWLLDRVPGIAGVVAGLFTSPVVGKVVKAAGDVATGWIRDRFGHQVS